MIRKLLTVLGVTCALAAMMGGSASAAEPKPVATDKIIIFSTEFQPLDQYENPSGCLQMPPLAHIIVNLTDKPVTAYGFPGCVGPSIFTVKPGFGIHTAGFGSVRVG
ncbi:MAG TPA: hypothetical protein VG317_02120 [Pseudonocardiaceae bacterium]|nr:hypothetical protein [Pseudonocardiaceae bacterium]